MPLKKRSRLNPSCVFPHSGFRCDVSKYKYIYIDHNTSEAKYDTCLGHFLIYEHTSMHRNRNLYCTYIFENRLEVLPKSIIIQTDTLHTSTWKNVKCVYIPNFLWFALANVPVNSFFFGSTLKMYSRQERKHNQRSRNIFFKHTLTLALSFSVSIQSQAELSEAWTNRTIRSFSLEKSFHLPSFYSRRYVTNPTNLV